MGFDGDTIVSNLCPTDFCCQLEECDYIEHEAYLCAPGRNTSSLLCGECNDGYSESVNSPQCTECDRDVHWEVLLFPLAFALGMTIFILATNTDKQEEEIEDDEELERPENAKKAVLAKVQDNQLMIQSFSKVVIYYEQVEF